MPPENELKSRVDFTYSNEPFEPDADKFWKKAGKKLDSSVESFLGKKKAMEDVVAQIVSPGDSPEAKLGKIYDRVQTLRNTSYEIQKTEQEEKRDKEKAAANVEEVWKRGYGNGRDINWLYLGLVRAAGFEAYPVVVSDRRNYFFIKANNGSQSAGFKCGSGKAKRQGSLLRSRSAFYSVRSSGMAGDRCGRAAAR